jgi:hypothetical protein
VKQASVDELLAPCYLFLTIDTIEKLLEGLGLFLGFGIRYNFDNASIFLGNFNS